MKLKRFSGRPPSWLEWARYDTWNVGIATLTRPLASLDDLHHLGDIRWLPERPPLYYIADPFPYRHDGREWILVEEYGHPKGVRGRIARIALDGDGTPEPVITRARHLSYPYTFTDGDRVLCAPEMGAERGCILYELSADGSWQPREHILRDAVVIDPVFLRHSDRWWLFCTDGTGAGSECLRIYHAASLGGEWTAHARNPVKCDRSSARSAGRPFAIGGRLFRPAQDCARTYGGAINVMELVELSPTAFREVQATRLEPDAAWPYPDGLHTLVVDGRRVYLDAKRTTYDVLRGLKVWLHRP